MGFNKKHRLYLLSDAIHSMSEVVLVVQEIMMFNKYQAEQCVILAHHKSKCELTTGSIKKLKFYQQVFTEIGITTEICYE